MNMSRTEPEPAKRVVLVPLSDLVAEGFCAGEPSPIDALTRQLGSDVTLDSIGRRVVVSEVARKLFKQRAAAQAEAEARRAVKAKAAAEAQAVARAKAQAERAAEARRVEAQKKVIAALGPGATALEVMKAADGVPDQVNAEWDRELSQKTDEMLSGVMTYHRIRDE